MNTISEMQFSDLFDTMIAFGQEAWETHGEDSYFSAYNEAAAMVSVCDGCGGLGSRSYPSCKGHTAAYMASRIVSGTLSDWFHSDFALPGVDAKLQKQSLEAYIQAGFDKCSDYMISNLKIKGSMVRDLPTTLAMAYACKAEDYVKVMIYWAGDSRVYLLNEKGLAQLTADDTDAEDAFENLSGDGALTNLLSSDGRYVIRSKGLRLHGPAMILACSDGCFGYMPSPMHFEYEILKALEGAEDPESFRETLKRAFSDYAGDDVSCGLMSFMYGSFGAMQAAFAGRSKMLADTYIRVFEEDDSDATLRRLWQDYRQNYERFIKRG